MAAVAAGEEKAGLSSVGEAVLLDRVYAKAYLDLGGGFMAQGRSADAVGLARRFEEAVGGPMVASLWLQGMARVRGGQVPEAEALARRLLAWSRESDVLNLAGRVAYARDRMEEAKALFEEAAAELPNPESHYRLGLIAARTGNPHAAENHWLEVYRMAPGFEELGYNLGLLYLETGRPARAVAHLRTAADEAPADADVRNALGAALASLQRWEDARDEFETALRLAPGHAGATGNLERLQGMGVLKGR